MMKRMVFTVVVILGMGGGIVLGGSAKVGVVDRAKVKAAAAGIDRLIEKDAKASGKKLGAIVSDEVFLRRVYLDIAGRIPTYNETVSFLKSKEAGKREKLIDKLLNSAGYWSHQFNYWADVLRIKSRVRGGATGYPYIDYVRTSLRENKGYDEFVKGLLAASGPANERGNGGTGYYLRDFNMPEDNMSNTVQVFLGTRLVCAQCHDHPFDQWTQVEFFEMVAFTGGVDSRYSEFYKSKKYEEIKKAMGPKMEKDREMRRAMGRLLQPLRYGVSGSGTGLAMLPKDYQYDDAKPYDVVKASTMFGENVRVNYVGKVPDNALNPTGSKRKRKVNSRYRPRLRSAQVNSRGAYVEWMTSPKNPRFTTVIANRLWKQAMGRGLIEPVDDFSDDTKASNEALMKHLEGKMVGYKYDMKQYLRMIYYSKAYQRAAMAEDVDESKRFVFTGPMLERMNGEQIWDSMITLVSEDVDGVLEDIETSPVQGSIEGVYRGYEGLLNLSAKEMVGRAKEIMNYERERVKIYADKTLSKTEKNQKIRELRNKQRNAYKVDPSAARLSKLYAAYNKAKKRGNKKQMDKLRKQINAVRKSDAYKKYSKKRYRAAYVRASEMTSQPARPGHLLREFGQSDRDQIEASHKDAAVTQVLSLLNGFVEKSVIYNKNSELTRRIKSAGSAKEKVNVIYLSILNRYPTKDEAGYAIKAIEEDATQGCEDLVWTLTNTHEFMFIQ